VLPPFRRLPGRSRLRAGRRWPRSPNRTFSGPRVAATLGYDISRSGSSVDNDNTRDQKQSIDGLLYGGEIGYDVPVGTNLVVGVDGEATGSTARGANTFVNTFNLGRVSAGRDFYVGGKIGYAVSPKAMLYVKGGYTNALQACRAATAPPRKTIA
jgi:outer membrane immunogenic protein